MRYSACLLVNMRRRFILTSVSICLLYMFIHRPMCKYFYDACYFTYLRVTPYWLNITDDNFETKLLVLASIYLYYVYIVY